MRTLVLNAGYEPLAVVSFKRAIVLVLDGKASIVASDDEHPVLSASGEWERPSVILLRRYSARCAYCGNAASTIDHVIPRSRGGADSWENLVACCLRCNNVKGDRTPQEMGWSLRHIPRPPHGTAWLVRGVERTQPQWEEFLAPAA
jgi:5-methylcytosine-specific restriction endonuclease McrA